MKKNFAGIILMLLLITGCEKPNIVELDLKGKIKGTIYTVDEFGTVNFDNENITVKLEGSEPLISINTDATGQYEISDIPSGTYNLVISKEGYGEYQLQGLQIVGGNVPLYYSYSIVEKSSTTIENLSLEIINPSRINLKCIVNHNYVINEGSTREPAIRYFIHTSEDLSNKNYLQTGIVSFNEVSGSQMEKQVSIDKNLFPGGKIYVIAYGCPVSSIWYYDILSNQKIYSSVGSGSNIANIIIP